MNFVNEKSGNAVKRISQDIIALLRDDKRVLWLVSGGSAVLPQVEIMKYIISGAEGKLEQLVVLPVDERYGPTGHDTSNSEQMRRAGFSPSKTVWHDVLANNVSFGGTIVFYGSMVQTAFDNADVVVATLGLGADAHTAGILPNSPAVEDNESPVVGYEWTDFRRMTVGLTQLRKINIAYVLAYGDNKEEALQRLQKNTEPLSALPAKVLYDIPDVTIYNDFISSEG